MFGALQSATWVLPLLLLVLLLLLWLPLLPFLPLWERSTAKDIHEERIQTSWVPWCVCSLTKAWLTVCGQGWPHGLTYHYFRGTQMLFYFSGSARWTHQATTQGSIPLLHEKYLACPTSFLTALRAYCGLGHSLKIYVFANIYIKYLLEIFIKNQISNRGCVLLGTLGDWGIGVKADLFFPVYPCVTFTFFTLYITNQKIIKNFSWFAMGINRNCLIWNTFLDRIGD